MKKYILKFIGLILNRVQQEKYEVYRKKYKINKDFRFNGKDIIFYGEGEISVGKESYIGSYSTIQSVTNQKVLIGENCSISHNVRIYTTSKLPDFDFSDKKNVPDKRGDVIIGNFVWIGANVFINPGVTIGDNSIIGANSVVTKNIEPFAIYGGVPAKLIRYKQIHNA